MEKVTANAENDMSRTELVKVISTGIGENVYELSYGLIDRKAKSFRIFEKQEDRFQFEGPHNLASVESTKEAEKFPFGSSRILTVEEKKADANKEKCQKAGKDADIQESTSYSTDGTRDRGPRIIMVKSMYEEYEVPLITERAERTDEKEHRKGTDKQYNTETCHSTNGERVDKIVNQDLSATAEEKNHHAKKKKKRKIKRVVKPKESVDIENEIFELASVFKDKPDYLYGFGNDTSPKIKYSPVPLTPKAQKIKRTRNQRTIIRRSPDDRCHEKDHKRLSVDVKGRLQTDKRTVGEFTLSYDTECDKLYDEKKNENETDMLKNKTKEQEKKYTRLQNCASPNTDTSTQNFEEKTSSQHIKTRVVNHDVTSQVELTFPETLTEDIQKECENIKKFKIGKIFRFIDGKLATFRKGFKVLRN